MDSFMDEIYGLVVRHKIIEDLHFKRRDYLHDRLIS